jgi:hypothetical protein
MKRKFLIILINLITLKKSQSHNAQSLRNFGFSNYLGQLEIRSIRSISRSFLWM